MKDSKFIFFLLFLIVIFSTYAPTKNKKQNLFSINKILIQGENRINFSELSNKLSLIKGKNLLYISNADIAKLLDNFKQIDYVKIKKIYPDTIKLIIEEKEIIGITSRNNELFLVTQDADLITFDKNDIHNIQKLIFIEGDVKKFLSLYKSLNLLNFRVENIKSVQYFDIGRWDIKMKDGIKIKLPVENYTSSLKNFKNLKSENRLEKFTIFDYRIENELILK